MRTSPLDSYQNGFRVSHIATTNIKTCTPSDIASEVFAFFPEFDQIPVSENGSIVGVLERVHSSKEGKVGEEMRGLSDGILVSADQPLIDFIHLMANEPYYRLVLHGTRIDGIVTRSDLLKLPVRVLAYERIANLELLLMKVIENNYGDSVDWIDVLPEWRQEKILNYRDKYKEENSDPELLEFTGLSDKGEIVAGLEELGETFLDDLNEISKLRNKIAHVGDFAENDIMLGVFLDRIEMTELWINKINKLEIISYS